MLIMGDEQFILMRKPITIIMYHSINNIRDVCTITPNAFQRQIEFIRSHFSIIRLKEIRDVLIDQELSRKVVITFDDAFRDFYDFAYPILDRYKIPSTVFIPTGFIGGFNDWDFPFHKCRKKSVMNANLLQELHRAKIVDFGSHTVDHLPMSEIDVNEMKRQAAGSKTVLEDLLRASVTMFAYPYGRLGDFSPLTSRILSETGYEIGVTTHWGTQSSIRDILCLRRISLRENDSYKTIRSKIEGCYDWIFLLKGRVMFGIRTLKGSLRRISRARKKPSNRKTI